jgi:hypothetical protein
MNVPVISPAVSAGDTGWSATIDACHDFLGIAFGEYSNMDTFERACREADRRAAARPQDPRLKRLRRLLEDDVSLERAYHELMRNRPAPKATVEALVYSLRRGVDALAEPPAVRRLAELSDDQLLEVGERLRKFKPEIARAWSADDVAVLMQVRERLK